MQIPSQHAELVSALVSQFPILGKLLSLSGQFTSVTWVRPIETASGLGVLTKETVCSGVRAVSYDARAVVGEMRESGELPAIPQPKKGFAYIAFPVLAQAVKSGHFYAVLTPRIGAAYQVTYRFNGNEVSKAEAQNLAKKWDAPSESAPLQLNIALPYLRAIS